MFALKISLLLTLGVKVESNKLGDFIPRMNSGGRTSRFIKSGLITQEMIQASSDEGNKRWEYFREHSLFPGVVPPRGSRALWRTQRRK